MSEFLERGRRAGVDDGIARWDASALRLTLVADEHPAVEMWEAERNAVPLMAEVFEKDVTLGSIAVPAEGVDEGEQAPGLFD